MLNLIDLRDSGLDPTNLATKLPRAALDVAGALQAIQPVMDEVKQRGAAALRDWAEKFDRVRPEHLRLPQSIIDEALASLDPEVREALELCIAHNRAGHSAQLPTPRATEVVSGGWVRQRWVPVRRVGLYAPGGLTVYPSSVVMNVVAAQVAGVSEIAVASPPQADHQGLPHPTVLAACALLGVQEVYAMGGAQAIAAFAYGAKPDTDLDVQASNNGWLVAPVDVVTGPGNVYVAAAKRAIQGVCGIDAEAGTTEIAIIADGEANPTYIALDLISQAEHDPAAASVLITDSHELAMAVDAKLERLVPLTKHYRRVNTALTGPQSGIVLTASLGDSIAVANAYAAEHLEIHTNQAQAVAAQIHNAGAVFVGPFTPVPLGDYMAGSNHVLPTGGTARFASGLTVMAFLKPVQEIEYTAAALESLCQPLTALALSEDLPAHSRSVQGRFVDTGEL